MKHRSKKTKDLKRNKKGLTLIELVVTVALMAVVGAIMAVSYTNVMEDKRMEADMSKLNNIDHSLEQILIYKDAFKDATECVVDNNKLNLVFPVLYNEDTGKAVIRLEDATLNTDENYLKDDAPIIYEHLKEFVGEEIQLDSASYKRGQYCVYIEFDGVQISSVRDYSITNDTMIITNSGDEYLYQFKEEGEDVK